MSSEIIIKDNSETKGVDKSLLVDRFDQLADIHLQLIKKLDLPVEDIEQMEIALSLPTEDLMKIHMQTFQRLCIMDTMQLFRQDGKVLPVDLLMDDELFQSIAQTHAEMIALSIICGNSLKK